MAFIAVYCALYRTYRLKHGESGTIMLLASDPRGGKDDLANAVAGGAYFADRPVSIPFAFEYVPALL